MGGWKKGIVSLVVSIVTSHPPTHPLTPGEQIQDALAGSNAAAGTSLSLIRTVRTHVGEGIELSNYDRQLNQTVNLVRHPSPFIHPPTHPFLHLFLSPIHPPTHPPTHTQYRWKPTILGTGRTVSPSALLKPAFWVRC